MTMTSVCGCRSFTLRSTSSPSPPRPMRRSVMTTSNSPSPSACSADARFSAWTTAWPSAVRRISSIVRMLSLSSTTSRRAMDPTLTRARRAHRFLLRREWESDGEHAASPGFAAHGDAPAMSLDDLVNDGEPQPRPTSLGGEERIEDARQILSGDALPGVLDLQESLADLALEPDGDAAAGIGRVARVAEQVPQDGLDLIRVHRQPHGRVDVEGKRDPLQRGLAAADLDRLPHQRDGVDRREVRRCRLREREEVLDQA